ncbi:MAG TPA: hypothetical protein VGC29_11045 [Flavisolibacter sp.]
MISTVITLAIVNPIQPISRRVHMLAILLLRENLFLLITGFMSL